MIKVHTDGGCQNRTEEKNGAWAFALSQNEYMSGGQTNTTSNRMELTAIIKAVRYVKSTYKNSDETILIYTDSQYCRNGFNKWMHSWKKAGWVRSTGELLNQDLWEELYGLRIGVAVKWVKGHNGDRMNEFVDELCNIKLNESV